MASGANFMLMRQNKGGATGLNYGGGDPEDGRLDDPEYQEYLSAQDDEREAKRNEEIEIELPRVRGSGPRRNKSDTTPKASRGLRSLTGEGLTAGRAKPSHSASSSLQRASFHSGIEPGKDISKAAELTFSHDMQARGNTDDEGPGTPSRSTTPNALAVRHNATFLKPKPTHAEAAGKLRMVGHSDTLQRRLEEDKEKQDKQEKEKQERAGTTTNMSRRDSLLEEEIKEAASHKKELNSMKLRKRSFVRRLGDPFWKSVINPNGVFKHRWDLMVMGLVVYVAIEVPYQACFLEQTEDWSDPTTSFWLSAVSLFMDIVFILDILLNFRTGVVENGVFMREQSYITHTYLHGWFPVDLVASIPFDWFITGGGGSENLSAFAIVKCTRLLRLGRLMRKLDQLNSANGFRVIKMVASFMLIAHWIACGWYFAGVSETARLGAEISSSPGFEKISWVEYAREQLEGRGYSNKPTIWRLYILSYYWSMTTLTTVGYGDMVPRTEVETRYTIGVQIVGSVLFSVIFGNVAVLISSFDAAYSRYRERMDMVNEFIECNAIPLEMRERMRGYVDYTWNMNKGLNVRELVMELPDGLRSDIFMHLYSHLVRAVPMFRDADPGVIKNLVMRLRTQVVFAGDFILEDGDMGREMYFVRRGFVEVMSGDLKTKYAELGPGCFFGEISLLTGGRRTATVRAIEMSEVYSLSKYDFDMVLREFPEEKQIFREIAQMRLKANKEKHAKEGTQGSKETAKAYRHEATAAQRLQSQTEKENRRESEVLFRMYSRQQSTLSSGDEQAIMVGQPEADWPFPEGGPGAKGEAGGGGGVALTAGAGGEGAEGAGVGGGGLAEEDSEADVGSMVAPAPAPPAEPRSSGAAPPRKSVHMMDGTKAEDG